MSDVTLYLGDCRTKLKRVASNSVDLIVTSPPYADQRSNTYGGIKPDDYVEWFMPIATELYRVLKPSGTFILNIKEQAVNGERHTYVLDLILRMRECGWLWTEEFIWHKKNCYPGKWPNRFRDAWERLLQFNKHHKFKMNQEAVMVPVGSWYENRMRNLSETDRIRDESKVGSGFGKRVENWMGRDRVYPTNVLHREEVYLTDEVYPTNVLHRATECGNRNHSAVFPYWLPEWFIDLFTDPGDVVLDPFIGSGTTAFAAVDKGRKAIGVENHKPYYRKLRQQFGEEEEDRMEKLSAAQIEVCIADARIEKFHEGRVKNLESLDLKTLLSRKNPYLFQSKDIVEVPDLIDGMLDAFVSSHEETTFGKFLERLAVQVGKRVHHCVEEKQPGMDLEFLKGDEHYIVSIKSGPYWSNNDQIKQMRTNFSTAREELAKQYPGRKVVAVNGCCYGRDRRPYKARYDYFKYCGQEFWELLSNDPGFYTSIIEPLGQDARKRDTHSAFREKLGVAKNRLIRDFLKDFCNEDGAIDWPKFVQYTSSITPPIERPVAKRDITYLRSTKGIVDTLAYWGMVDLANTIGPLMSSDDGGDFKQPVTLEDARGFLMVAGTVEWDAEVSLDSTEEGLLSAIWTFSDRRSLVMQFFGADRVTLTASDSDGNPVRIRSSSTSVRRDTATKRLVERGIFRWFEEDLSPTNKQPATSLLL